MTAYAHLYVHVPFCARRCAYCDFAIAVRREVPVDEYIHAVGGELAVQWPEVTGGALQTVYLGGGTPSRLGAAGVAVLLERIRSHAAIAHDAEVTLEANPEDITSEAVRAWRAAGVNRLSIGVQSFSDRVLQWMHRVHDGAAAVRAVQTAQDVGLTNLSLDLIFALPAELERDWSSDLQQAVALAPTHVSLYGLTIEPNTPLGRWTARGAVVPGEEDAYVEEFLEAHAVLDAAGFQHYEVSNFARPGFRAVHNSAYWRGVPYLGVGPGAHGFDGVTRRWNLGPYVAWRTQVHAGQDPAEGHEELTQANRTAESVYLGLRTSDGLPVSAEEWRAVAAWVDAGWVEQLGEGPSARIRCSPSGWLRLDRLAADLTALRSHS